MVFITKSVETTPLPPSLWNTLITLTLKLQIVTHLYCLINAKIIAQVLTRKLEKCLHFLGTSGHRYGVLWLH